MALEYLRSATARAREKGEAALAGEIRGLRAYLPFLGPAIIASIAYMDPGNFATNIQSGATLGYELLWVALAANLIAMLFQALSAKLGIVTGKSLAELCAVHFPRSAVYFLWAASELAAVATDVAEVLGGAVGLSLVGIPLTLGCIVMGVVTLAILSLQGFGFRPMEVVIGAFMSVISVSYVAELFIAPPHWGQALAHTFVPSLAGNGAAFLAVGIVGATVMPHAVYLHSALTKDRVPARSAAAKRRALTFSNREVLLALGVAGVVNMAMMAVAADALRGTGAAGLETAYHTLMPLFGGAAAGIFVLSLVASGVSSSVVGTMAGASIMQDFVPYRIPLWVRRAATLVPALILAAFSANPTHALIGTQVLLSLVLPVPLAALVFFTSRRKVMGAFANSLLTTVAATLAGLVVVALNIVFLLEIAGLPLAL